MMNQRETDMVSFKNFSGFFRHINKLSLIGYYLVFLFGLCLNYTWSIYPDPQSHYPISTIDLLFSLIFIGILLILFLIAITLIIYIPINMFNYLGTLFHYNKLSIEEKSRYEDEFQTCQKYQLFYSVSSFLSVLLFPVLLTYLIVGH